MVPTLDTILKALHRCFSLRSLRQVHAQLLLAGHCHRNLAAVKLLSFAANSLGDLAYARGIFRSLAPLANVFLWTAMISSDRLDAVLLYQSMLRRGPPPNEFTLSAVLKACSLLRAVWEGKQVHGNAVKLGFGSAGYVETALIDMYGKVGLVRDARRLFEEMPVRNVVACNAVMTGFVKAGDLVSAREVFDGMPERDSASWNVMVSGYACKGVMVNARELFEAMPKRGVCSWTALIAGYGCCGEWHEAIRVFNAMRWECVEPDRQTMAVLMSVCGQLGALKVAGQFHGYVQKHGMDMNLYVLNSLVDMYAKCGSVSDSQRVFYDMSTKDVVSYNVMISGFANHGYGEDALRLFSDMLEAGIEPDIFTFLGILAACCHAGLVDTGCRLFTCMSRDFGVEPAVDHYACIVDLFGRAGLVEEAYELVKAMPIEPHAGVWGALLNACRNCCDIEIGEVAAQELFRIEPMNPGNYVLLSDIYAKAQSWDNVTKMRSFMRERGVKKTTGCSWIQVDHEMHEFLMKDTGHPLGGEIYGVLEHIYSQFLQD